MRGLAATLGCVVLAACGCSGPAESQGTSATTAATAGARPAATVSQTSSSPVLTAATPRIHPATPTPTHTGTPTTVVIRYRLERRTTDAATADFVRTVRATLTDPRGWQRGDVRFVEDRTARYLIVLAEPDETQRLCRPYDVYRRYSCQNGPVVALNADRWRHATPQWTGTLAAYRQMLVNHEVGHLLGLHHPNAPQCPKPGQLAPIMAQQSTELDGCRPNPWPLPAEVALLARHELPLAPPPD